MRSKIRGFLVDRSGDTCIEAVVLSVMLALIVISLASV